LAVSIEDGAALISVSESHFKRHVLPRVRTIMVGRRRLVVVKDLERFLESRAV